MVDSWGKIPSGLMRGNIFEFGNFEECVNFKRDLPEPFGTMEGQYCKAFLKLPKSEKSMENVHFNMIYNSSDIYEKEFSQESRAGSSLSIGSGICIPKSCEYDLFLKYLKENNKPITILGCSTNDPVKMELIDYFTL